MVRRINKKHITFQFPFAMDEIHKVFPAGDYTIETEEESIPGSAVVRFRHVETVLVVRPSAGEFGPVHFWPVDPDALNKAIVKDADQYLTATQDARRANLRAKKAEESD